MYAAALHVIDFRYLAPFQNQSVSKATGSKIVAKFRITFEPYVKILVGMDKMSE